MLQNEPNNSMLDARNVCAQYQYDRLNRITHVGYSDRTPAVTNNYDQAPTGYFNKGRLTEVITASVSDDTGTSYDDSVPETRLNYDFDLMGRTVKSSQTVDSNVYNLSYKYNLGGQLTQETYPSAGWSIMVMTKRRGYRMSTADMGT